MNATQPCVYPKMRPQDILMPRPGRPVAASPAASISTRCGPSSARVITHGHSDHARPGHGAVLATQETLDMMRLRYGDNFAGATQAIALWRRDQRSATSRSRSIPRAMCWARRRSRSPATAHLHRRLRRLQGRARPDLRAVRAGALRRLHHRGDVRPAGVPPWRCGGRDRTSCWHRWRCFRSARIWSAPIRSARRSA